MNRNKKLYTELGYLNFDYIFKMSEKHNCPYIFIVGGRGTGKTYGALEYLTEHKIKLFFMRRTQTQFDIIKNPEFNPYKSLNIDKGTNISFFTLTKYNAAIYEADTDENNKLIPNGESLGVGGALSTISNLRGFDASDIDVVLFDEFIPEKHERPIKNEATALFNALETIGRNRELKKNNPLKLIALANSNDISNDYFVQLKLVGIAERMAEKGQELYCDDNRGILLIILKQSPIGYLKKRSSLYRLTEGTDFSSMSICNNFVGVVRDCIHSEDLRQYRIYITLGELAIYKHKSENTYYITNHISGVPKHEYSTSINSIREFRAKHHNIWFAYIINKVKFETYVCQVLFEKYHRMS